MGGAERNARKRRQQRTSVGKAASTSAGSNRVMIVAIAAVIVLAAVVVGGVIWSKSGSDGSSANAIPVAEDSGKIKYSGERNGVRVVRGAGDATATIDLYEDFMCPACGQFEQKYGDKIDKKIESGELRVRYHMVPLLTDMSNPPGYSLDAANAALCAADEGKFARFHESLFAAQPQEGQGGYDKDQLTGLGRNLGIEGDEFASCVDEGKYDDELNAALEDILDNPDLKRSSDGGEGRFGTPMVTHKGEVLGALRNPNWLEDLLGGEK